MPYGMIARGARRKTLTRRRRAHSSAVAWRLARRAVLALRAATLAVRIVVGAVLLVAVWAAVNWMVQVARKPTELFFPVSGALIKAPAQTWRQYGPLFTKHSTAVITPELLAALAQVEGSGNPIARSPAPSGATASPPPRCSSGRISRRSSTCAGARPATHTRAAPSGSDLTSDAATTTPAATWQRSTR